MSVRELSPLFSWGFSLRRSKWLVPLFNNNVLSFGSSAVNGPYGWNLALPQQQKRFKSSEVEINDTQIREKHTHTSKHKDAEIRASLINSIDIKEEIAKMAETSDSNNVLKETVVVTTTIQKTSFDPSKLPEMSDGEIIDLLQSGSLGHYALEKYVSAERAVKIRRMFIASNLSSQEATQGLYTLPFEHYNYDQVKGVCCENVVGYVPIPVGVVGPFKIDGKDFYVPMATTEGALIASTQRGAKAISMCGGASSVILADGMTRAPVVQMPNAKRAGALKQWLAVPENCAKVEGVFNSTSRFARLSELKVAVAGRKVYIRFKCVTGDAMGMNMVTKATDAAILYLKGVFADMNVLSLSGNYCTDKKPSSINWIEGRGKSVVCDVVISKDVVKNVLKTTVDDIVQVNIDKNLIGSAMAGSIGGFNAHASNIVTAVFLATGQDCAQNVESSNCITLMEKDTNGDLYMSVTMPSIEVGTVGGGTNLSAQAACLEMLGVKGPNPTTPGANAQTLARVVASTVMAGELSLMSALASNHLLKAHIELNRKK
jgi:hydroxymethylglutaryl-CoA reductase (NADPH)